MSSPRDRTGTRRWLVPLALSVVPLALAVGCAKKDPGAPARTASDLLPGPVSPSPAPPTASVPPTRRVSWAGLPMLEPGQVFALGPDGAPVVQDEAAARAAGLLVVDLGDEWAPFIFSESDGDGAEAKPSPYRRIFIDLANDRVSPDVLYLRGDGPTQVVVPLPQGLTKKQREALEQERQEARQKLIRRLQRRPARNYLEVYGIPPTLSVLRARLDEDEKRVPCYAALEPAALAEFSGSVTYTDLKQSRKERAETASDEAWALAQLRDRRDALEAAGAWQGGTGTEAELEALAATDERTAARVQRLRQGRARVRAIEVAQARLRCEGLIDPATQVETGTFDLTTHEALAEWERKNDIFSWGILGGETLAALQRPPLELHFETFQRILTERVVDAAAILEDESLAGSGKPPSYRDAAGNPQTLRDLVSEHRQALLAALGIAGPEDMIAFLQALGPQGADRHVPSGLARLRVAFAAPPKPDYHDGMELEVVIDRGDVWYDFPFDDRGQPATQARRVYPSLTVLASWRGQKIPLVRWRTTIGHWRSELHPDGNVYYKYKNSDVGPRIWQHIVAAPVWVPPDGTPGRELLTRKKFEPHAKPETVVNTEVMGPGFNSAYGLVMAIHHEVKPGGKLFDNQIRTHGSVDYTSIARRYSHGCHRLVNVRAVRLFGFVLRHTPFERLGNSVLGFNKKFAHEGQEYEYRLNSRGYYFRLKRPVKVEVLEGNVKGNVKKPIEAFVRKPGVDYSAARRAAGPAAAELSDDGEVLGLGPAAGDPTPAAALEAGASGEPAPRPAPLPPVIDPAAARGEAPARRGS